MENLNRRDALQLAAGLPLIALAAGAAPAAAEPEKLDPKDRERVQEAGLTAEEAECWELTAQLAGKLLALPKLHPMEQAEIASTIHVLQYRLLSRATYRRYLEITRKAGQKQEKP